jgi:predicted nuclease of restriction endonuclease-like (RecB) superfamily
MRQKKEIILSGAYVALLSDIKKRLISARIKTARSVNKELIHLYWEIGKSIAEKQAQNNWGDGVVEKLSADLRKEFHNTFGLSVQNLWYMRKIYLEYKDKPILQQLVGELPWGHNILILSNVKDTKAREYYLRASAEMGWSRNVLLNQIKADAYRLSLKKKQHNFEKALPVHLAEQADESLKSVYNLDFLGVTKPILERDLEKRIVEKIKHFILELGSGFSFIGNQYRLELDGNEYFIDLLFFNRKLKCLVAIELKAGDFKPEYAGKMDFYLHLLNDKIRFKDENPSIGIILCAQKKNIVVEYALRSTRNPVGVAEYKLTRKLPGCLKKYLPSEKDLIAQVSEEMKEK